MDVPALPDENGKSWDYPLTTDEMREHKNDWSLASDVGLLRHLQKFSENITSKVEKTQSALDDLSTGLNEASLMVDNVTNISLALANTQFIESRVRDDETDANCLKKNEEEIKDLIKEPSESDMITAVSTSILEGLKLMDEKYERLEVIASSDSDDDDDDENEMPAQSVIIKPKDFYQNRGLPYVIGSEKWKSSNKIGLESSSSESEMPDEEEEEEDDDDDEEDMRGEYPDSEKETKLPERIFSSSSRSKGISRSSSCTSTSVSSDSKSNNTNEQSSHTGKIYTRSQDTLNSTSEIETITNEILTKDIRKETPSFAEELARRLGNVFPARKKSIDNNHHHDSDQASINRSHDDLFESDDNDDDGEDNNDVLSKKKDNLFGDTCDLFDDDKLTSDLWKNKPAVRVQKNIIPSSLDVPPPINTVDVKPKSSIDDLFRDNYSDDSDDIFAPKSSWLSSKSPSKSLKSQDLDREKSDKVKRVDNVMTSTPEANNNIPNLFNDDDEDDDDDDNLFSPFDKNISKINNEKSKNSSRQVPGVLINKTDLLSSTLGSRLLNRKLNSDSSENESNEANKDNKNRESSVGSFMVNKSESMLFAGNIQQQQQQQHDQEQPDHTNNENPSGDSSGISIQPRSVNSTLGLGLGEWEPQMESTRLRSEEIYREPILSDSLLTSPVNKPEIINEHSYNNNNSQATQESSKLSDNNINDYDDDDDDEDDDDDVFGPPPLPQKTTSKIKSNISSSLFDDSDSGDDLFSNTSSGSRSQKSTTDHQAATHEKSNEKSKVIKSRGLFDEPYDLFSNTSVPDIDIFNVQPPPPPPPPTTSNLNEQKDKAQSLLITSDKKLFKPVSNLFDDEDDDYLFGVTLSTENKKPVEIMEENKSQAGSLKSENLNDDKISNEEIKKSSEEDKKLSEKNKIPSEKDEEQSKKNIFDDIDDASNSSLFDDKSKKPNKTTVDKVEEKTTIDGPVASKINTEKVKNDITKIEPPKTLKIRLPNISDTDDTSQVTKRVVSNKIANIMGKMSNLKILSPTDTPPLFRKSTEKSETDDDNSEYDSQDGSSVSLPKSLPQSPKKEFEIKNTPTSPTTLETESAVSFDVPAQPETLLVRSKSRAKITAKRRPQSRHARQTALRHSGLDFDSVDDVDSKTTGEPIDRLSDKQPNIISLNSTVDDKSEMSLGKESSISITKNTLLSPSTDEEDLFDVPPDLPEDPQREDTLFGRGPILSPFDDDNAKQKEDKKVINYKKTEEEKIVNKKLEKDEDPLSKKEDDILKDPSQLFARVTKTPSPEKNRNQIFDEDDDSLFSEASMKDKNKKGKKETIEEVKKGRNDDNGGKKIDLFGDDDDDTSDLFSGPFTKKIGKKSVKTTTRGLFDDNESDDDEGDDLFGSASSKQSKSDDVAETINIIDAKKSNNEEEEEEEDEEELFFDASEKSTEAGKNNQQIKITKQKLENIFGDSENIDDDIFLNKNKSSTGLFGDDDDKVPGSSTSNAESRGGVIKKPVTKDLKKTAEKIDEDPLSMFQDE